MVDELIYKFSKVNEERKLFIFYLAVAIPLCLAFSILDLLFSWVFTIFIAFFIVVMFLILFLTYFYMCHKVKVKIFTKKVLNIESNITRYRNYRDSEHKKFIVNYLKSYNLFTDEKILFLIESIRLKKEPKFKRDWLSFICTIILTILVASIKDVKIDKEILLNILGVVACIGIIIFLIYFVHKLFFKEVYNIISVKSGINKIELILSDIYLGMNVGKLENKKVIKKNYLKRNHTK